MSVIDEGMLSPVTVGHDSSVSDAAVLDALIGVEVALVRAYAQIGVAPAAVAEAVSEALEGRTAAGADHGIDAAVVAQSAVAGGNPVIPLVALMKQRVPRDARVWVHRGATSQDILDTALIVVARRAIDEVSGSLDAAQSALEEFARAQRDDVAAARTLTQHAVPTTVGLRAATWLQGLRRAATRLRRVRDALPAQLGGAAGTLASFVQITGSAHSARLLVDTYAAHVGLVSPEAPWHVSRWPVTELGDALVQTIDAVGKVAGDVVTLARPEIGELSEAVGGGSSAMPQKQNPARSVLVRSAALRAPQLGATLHLAAALAVDERPDGAWHAEWPTLRELLRLALGASAHAVELVRGLRVDEAAVARNLALSSGLIVSERLSAVLGPVLGSERITELVTRAAQGGDLAELVRAAIAGTPAAGTDVDDLLDPACYTGLAAPLVDAALRGGSPAQPNHVQETP